MKVRIKSGSQAGAVVEMSTIEAQNNIATGFAEAVAPEVVAEAVVAKVDDDEPAPVPRRHSTRGRVRPDED